MKTLTAILAVACSVALVPSQALGQPTRNAIKYAARAVGQTEWTFGALSLQSLDTDPITFEIGVFIDRAQGLGFATGVYKTYIDGVSLSNGDSARVVVDPGPAGHSVNVPNDGRVGWFDNGAQTQGIFLNRHASVPGSGFRIAAPTDNTDASAAGGISVKQAGPIANPHFDFTYSDIFVYRFNVTLACTGDRTVLIHTPLSRINSFATYNMDGSNTTSEHKATAVVDSLTLHASWIPAPSTLALLGLGGLVAARRRR